MGQRPQQHVHRPVGAQVVEDGVDPPGRRIDPGIDLVEEVHPVRRGPSRIRNGERRSRRRFEGAEDIPLAASPVVDLLRRPDPPRTGRIGTDQTGAAMAFGALRSHLIQADHDAVGRWGLVEGDDRPLFSAKAGSTRSPNHVSWVRQRTPSACRISPIRLRCIVMPWVADR